ncbi:methyltransferase domain-containing protein, partial [Baffinella frigidus]
MDYYPRGWTSVGDGRPSDERPGEWAQQLPPWQGQRDWCPSRGSAAGLFVEEVYSRAAANRTAECGRVERVGAEGDGGKWICVDDQLLPPEDCVVYSLGSRLDFSFESDLVARFGCEVHTFDCTVGTPPPAAVPRGVAFHPWCVGGKDAVQAISSDLGHEGESRQYFTLATILGKLGHEGIALLKMDIERHELAVVAALTGEAAPAQIAFETHLHNAYGMWGRPVTEGEWDALWGKLHALGYGVFANEPNPRCLCCCEFSLRR